MCRYSIKSYKPHFVCFDCRKTFKQPLLEDMLIQNDDWEHYQSIHHQNKEKAEKYREKHPDLVSYFEKRYLNREIKCPQCSKTMYNIGRDFKAPKKEKEKKWEVIRSMFTLGHQFLTCGCYGPGYIPQSPKAHLNQLKNIKLIYQENLQQRTAEFTPEDLEQYINYWTGKLQAITKEINKFSDN